MIDSRKIIILYCPVPDEEIALQLGSKLVHLRLAACTQYWPVTSQFFWEGQAQKEGEYILWVKTFVELGMRAQNFLTENHPYRTACILTLHATVNEAYYSWMKTELGE